jgi:pyruvate,water dikinase
VARALAAEVLEVDAALEDVQAGGKALGLAAMLRARCKVPKAFVISAHAYARHRESPPGSGCALAAADPGLAAAIAAGWESLGRGAVAVRSSGLREDSAGGSQAGRHVTVLNVSTFDGLLEAVVEVWRHAAGLGTGEAVGVVVQRQLRPVSAGVMLTNSPEAPGRVLIESRWGLGVGVVGGHDSDRIVVDGTGRVAIHVAAKADMVEPAGQGGTIHSPTPSELVEACSLSEKDARRLARLGRRLEKTLGTPQDIEWALVGGGELYLVQSRPVAAPDTWDAPPPAQPFDLWSRVTVAELLPDPVSPFTWSLGSEWWSEMRRMHYRRIGVRGLRDVQFFRLFDYRVYFNIGAGYYLRGLMGRGTEMLGPYGISTESLGRHGVQRRRPAYGRLLQSMPRLLAGAAASAWSRRGARESFETARATAARYHAQEVDGLSAGELWVRFEGLRREIAALEVLERAVDNAVYGAGRHLEILCHWWLGDRTLMRDLAAAADPGGPASIAPELARLSELAPDDVRSNVQADRLGDLEAIRRQSPEWCREFDAFLDRVGHRTDAELEWAQPRWREDPAPVLAALRACLASGSPRRSATPADWGPIEREVFTRLGNLPMERILPWRRLLFRVVLRRARRLLPLRSIPRDRIMLLYLEGRRILLALGTQLQAKGVLDAPGDLFLLTVSELESLVTAESTIDARAVVGRRRLQLSKAALRPAPDVVGPDGCPVTPPEASTATNDTLQGLGAVPGVVRGTVRIVRRRDDVATVRLGEVLVLASTDISSTLLFPLAGAMVVEEGGLLSHATVLAREYGVPTVVQARGATGRLADGAQVEVDGGRGIIRVVADR